MAYPNIEKLPGKTHYTGYATFRGKQVIYRITKSGKTWRAVEFGGTYGAPTLAGRVLGEISSALYNIELQYPKGK